LLSIYVISCIKTNKRDDRGNPTDYTIRREGMHMARFTMLLIFVELSLGILFMMYEFVTGQPWANDGVPWTMEGNFHFTIALGCFVGAGLTFVFGAVIGSIGRRNHAMERGKRLPDDDS
jgi:hypothetical protein